ncbi:MAG: IS1380 family transposase [Rhodobacteraceae bacterium]|nr:IS1380 family transposase [Paracoccaceae bacterium]
MTVCTGQKLSCQSPDGVRQSRIDAYFPGGTITPDAGVLLAGLAAQGMNLFDRLGACFRDQRRPELTVHSCRSLAGQRVPGILLGCGDLSDHEELRKDPALGAVPGRLEPRRADCAPLAGRSTLNRSGLSAAGVDPGKARKTVAGFGQMDQLMVDLFMERHAEPPEEIVIDLDATDFELHGGQEKRCCHGYYDEYCYLPPLYFRGRDPVMVRLCAAGVEEDPETLVRRLRERWPDTRIILRTDSGFCRDSIMSWCERTEGVDYVIGVARNARLEAKTARQMRRPRSRAAVTGVKPRRFRSFRHRTRNSWSRTRRVIGRAGALPGRGAPKPNARFIVTPLPASEHPARRLYEDFYCARGDAENRVKDLKTGLFADRCSSNLFSANALRLRFSAFAHILHNRIAAAAGGKPAGTAPETLRLRLLKIGARVRLSVRRIHFAMSGACPDRQGLHRRMDEPRTRLTDRQRPPCRRGGPGAPGRRKRPRSDARFRTERPSGGGKGAEKCHRRPPAGTTASETAGNPSCEDSQSMV